MKLQEVIKECNLIKQERKAVVYNYYNNYDDDRDFDVIQEDGSILFGTQDSFVYRMFFCSNNMHSLEKCLRSAPKDAVIYNICKGEIGDLGELIEKSGWKLYSVYLRNSVLCNQVHEKGKTEIVLEKMYDPECAQLATAEDIEQLEQIMNDTFDPISNEIPTRKELEDAIKNETLWIYKVKDKICTIYLYKIEGRKRYGAMTYNCLSANYLYNVTRKANEISNRLHNPIVHYGWIDITNKKIIRTLKNLNSLSKDGVKNYIYVKN